MIVTPKYLLDLDRVVGAFGYWPAFHDARFGEYERSFDEAGSIEFVIHGWEMTRETDERGYFRRIKHHLVRLRFEDIAEEALDELGKENIVDLLAFSPTIESDGRFQVTLTTAMDAGGSFRARRGQVLSVTPCNEQGRAVGVSS